MAVSVSAIDSASLWAGITTESFIAAVSHSSAFCSWISLKHVTDVVGDVPVRVVGPEGLQVRDPPAVIPDTRLVRELPFEFASGDLLAHGDRLQHRAVAGPPAPDVVDRPGPGRLVKGLEGGHQVGRVDVVADLPAAVAEDRVRVTDDRAAHQIREEAVQFGAGVIGARETAAPKAHRRHIEVATVLLDQEVRRRLGHAEQRMRGCIDGHRGVDAAVVAVVGREFKPVAVLDQREAVGEVAVDLVRRTEDERRGGERGDGRSRAGSACRWR